MNKKSHKMNLKFSLICKNTCNIHLQLKTLHNSIFCMEENKTRERIETLFGL